MHQKIFQYIPPSEAIRRIITVGKNVFMLHLKDETQSKSKTSLPAIAKRKEEKMF